MKSIKVIDSTYTHAVADGCDLVQYKYRGLWCSCIVARGTVMVNDPWGSDMTTFQIDNREVSCELIGDYFGPPRHELSYIVVYDCWSVGQETGDTRIAWKDIREFSYRDRFAFVRQQLGMLGLPFRPIVNYPIAKSAELWANPPADTNGLIWRRAKDNARQMVRVARQYVEKPGAMP